VTGGQIPEERSPQKCYRENFTCRIPRSKFVLIFHAAFPGKYWDNTLLQGFPCLSHTISESFRSTLRDLQLHTAESYLETDSRSATLFVTYCPTYNAGTENAGIFAFFFIGQLLDTGTI
jgi:hypothetical protein